MVVHDAGDTPFELGLEGNNVASTALGDKGLLQKRGIGGGGNDPAELVQQALVGLLEITPDASQGLTGRIHHLAPVVDATAYFSHHVGTLLDTTGLGRQQGELGCQAGDGPFQSPSTDEGGADVQ